MNNSMLRMFVNVKAIMASEEGLDLVEYALVVALISFGAILGMQGLAAGINTAFGNISTVLSADV